MSIKVTECRVDRKTCTLDEFLEKNYKIEKRIYSIDIAIPFIEFVILYPEVATTVNLIEENDICTVIGGGGDIFHYMGFVNNEFKLDGKIYKELEGKDFQNLPRVFQRRIKGHYFNFNVFDYTDLSLHGQDDKQEFIQFLKDSIW